MARSVISVLQLLSLASILGKSGAFTSPAARLTARRSVARNLRIDARRAGPPLSMSASLGGGGGFSELNRGGGKDSGSPHTARVIKDLLLDRSMASVCYYWMEFKDDLTPRWLSQFTTDDHEIQEVGWKKHLFDLMRADPEEVTVRRVVQQPRGGSRNNPYLSAQRHHMEYQVTIEPFQIASKVMDMRERIAKEWIHDLKLMELENLELNRHHVDSLSATSKEEVESMRGLVFETDPFDADHSPYRNANYRRLMELSTDMAVKRFQKELRARGARYELNWLEKFLARNDLEEKNKLVGNAFLEAVLNGPMIMIRDPRRDTPRVIEPLNIGRGIMGMRKTVAAEITQVLGDIPGDHSMLKRARLEERLRATSSEDAPAEHKKRIVSAVATDKPFPDADEIRKNGPDQDSFEV